MRRWKVVTVGSAVIVALSVGGTIVAARHPAPGSHSVDLAPVGPIVLGIVGLLMLWIVAFVSWYLDTLRKTRRTRQDRPDHPA